MLQRWEYVRLLGCPAFLFKKPRESPQAYFQGSHSGGIGVPKLSQPASMWLFSEKQHCTIKSSHVGMYVENQKPEVERSGQATEKTWLYISQQGHHLSRRTSLAHGLLMTQQSARDQEMVSFS